MLALCKVCLPLRVGSEVYGKSVKQLNSCLSATMDRQATVVILLVFMFGICYDSYGEIHRARGISPRGVRVKLSTPRSTWPPGPHRPVEAPSFAPACAGPSLDDEDGHLLTADIIENRNPHSVLVWIYAITSAVLVGLSGIFPLLIIPLEAGEALKHGAPAARLKLLLSFAVGGLLGDVFLHLLPEAWAHLPPDDVHAGHTRIGMWVITGLLSFLVIEKIFPDDKDEEEEEKEKEEQYTKVHAGSDTTHTEHTTAYNLRSKGKQSVESSVQNGNPKCNGDAPNRTGNGSVVRNGFPACTVEKTETPSITTADKNSHIKTSGWLNLLANVIDNFTHGLAVAGSYCCGIKVGLLTTCAILLHEVPHEMGDFAILLRSGFDRWQAAKAQLLTAMGGLIGALTALTASSVEQAGNTTAWILPFTSGGFIYIALVTVVPDLLQERNPRESFKQVVLLVLGIVTMAMVTLLSE